MDTDTVTSTNEFRIMPGLAARYRIEVRIKGHYSWRLLAVSDTAKRAQQIIEEAKQARLGEIQ